MSPCKQNYSYNNVQNYNKIYRLTQSGAHVPHLGHYDCDQSLSSQQLLKATSSIKLVKNYNSDHNNNRSSTYSSSSYDDISHIINSSSSSSSSSGGVTGGQLATALGDHHHYASLSNQHGQAGGRLESFLVREETASAMVGCVRLVLVILICVLVAKLRSPKLNNNRAKARRFGGTRDGEADDYYNESHRETKISETAANGSGVGYNKQRDLNDNLGIYLNEATATATNKQQQHRRYSQPILPAPQLANSSSSTTKQATTTSSTSNWQQQADNASERRRRHSDTAISSLQLPPGPTGLPFLGYLPFLGSEIHLTLTDLSRKFGPIYQIFLGGIRVVVLNDASLVRQAFKQTVFSGRPDTQLTRILQGYGIVNSEGALWKEQRAFLHSALRKLGAKSLMSGTNGLEAKIQVSSYLQAG